MKNVLYLVLALIVASILWGVIKSLVFGLVGLAFHLAMFGLFCYLVYSIFTAMTRQKM